MPGVDADSKRNRAGVSDAEIDRLCDAVLMALAGGSLGTEELRDATGGAVRNLGAEGKKKGLTTTLPVALGRLQAAGEIRRIPINGRFDQQRYRYTPWNPNPLRASKAGLEESLVRLAARFFRWTGPAALAEFQWFSGMGARVVKAAIEPLKLVPLEDGDSRLMFSDDRDAYDSYTVPRAPRYALVGSLDGISHLRRDLKSLLAEADRAREIPGGRGMCAVGGLTDLPGHAIFDRGRLMGLWEYDTETATIVWMSFVPADAALKDAVQRTEEFVRNNLGDARSFSLDSPKSRALRVAALRSLKS